LRYRQWIKNLLIFAPLFFSIHLFDSTYFIQVLYLFVAFCILASIVYIINDIKDYRSDSYHPSKKHRPIASKKTLEEARKLIIILLLLLLIICVFLSWQTRLVLILYLTFNILYTYKLKYIPFVDIFAVTLMYIIRIYAGAIAINVSVSPWLSLCTFFLALFLITAKRRSEFVQGK